MERRTFIKYSLVGLGVTALGPILGADRPDHEIMSCIGLGELKQVFNHGKLAVVTSVRSLPSAFDGNPGDAVEVSLQQLGMATVDGVIIRWTDGLHLTMGDYDLLAERLSQRLPDTVTGGGIFVDIEPELDPGEPGLVHALWALS